MHGLRDGLVSSCKLCERPKLPAFPTTDGLAVESEWKVSIKVTRFTVFIFAMIRFHRKRRSCAVIQSNARYIKFPFLTQNQRLNHTFRCVWIFSREAAGGTSLWNGRETKADAFSLRLAPDVNAQEIKRTFFNWTKQVHISSCFVQ